MKPRLYRGVGVKVYELNNKHFVAVVKPAKKRMICVFYAGLGKGIAYGNVPYCDDLANEIIQKGLPASNIFVHSLMDEISDTLDFEGCYFISLDKNNVELMRKINILFCKHVLTYKHHYYTSKINQLFNK